MTIANIIRIGMWICVLPFIIIMFLWVMAFYIFVEALVAGYDFLLHTGDPAFEQTKEILADTFRTVKREIRTLGQ